MAEPKHIPVSTSHYLIDDDERYRILHENAGIAGYVWQEPDSTWTASNVYKARDVIGLIEVTDLADPVEAARAYLHRRDH